MIVRGKNIVIIAVSVAIAAAIAFYLYSESCVYPRRKLFEKTGVELTGTERIEKYSRYYDEVALNYAYMIGFDESDYNDMIEKVDQITYGRNGYDVEIIKTIADGENGVPVEKHWLNTEKESILWWDCLDELSMRLVITKSNAERYYLYIEWAIDSSALAHH